MWGSLPVTDSQFEFECVQFHSSERCCRKRKIALLSNSPMTTWPLLGAGNAYKARLIDDHIGGMEGTNHPTNWYSGVIGVTTTQAKSLASTFSVLPSPRPRRHC